MPDRTLNWGADGTEATYRTQDTDAASGGGNFVVVEDIVAGTVLLEYDTASGWQARASLDLNNNDLSGVGALNASNVTVANTVDCTDVQSSSVDTGSVNFTSANLDPSGSGANDIFFGGLSGVPVIYPTSDDTGQLGAAGLAWSDVRSYSFFDASSGTTLSDGGSALDGLATMGRPPDFCVECDDSGEVQATDIGSLSSWLFEVAKEQQQCIEALETTVEDLKNRVESLENT